MAERVPKQTIEVRILPSGDEGVVISDSAGDEILWTAERDGVEYEIRFPSGSPFKDGAGNPKVRFKAKKTNPESSGKGYYNAYGGNTYHYEIHPPQATVRAGAVAPADQPTPGAPLKDPIIIVDP